MRRGGQRLFIAVGAIVASMALTAPAGAHHGVPEEDGVAPGHSRPGDRTFGSGTRKVHTIPVRRGGLLDYGVLPNGDPLYTHGPDFEVENGAGEPQPRNHLPLPPQVPHPARPAVPDTGFAQVDDTIDSALDEAFGPEPAPVLPPPPPPLPECVAPGTANSYELIYYKSSASTDRYEEVLPTLRQMVGIAYGRMQDEALLLGDFYRVFKFETEADCQPRIQNISGTQPNIDFGSVVGDLATNFGKIPNTATGNRKYVVFVERTPTKVGSSNGQIFRDESKSPSNQNNTRTGYALVASSAWNLTSATTLHEITHTLGGVQARSTCQEGSPNNNTSGTPTCGALTERWHCTDESAAPLGDVMCQNDAAPALPTSIVCEEVRRTYDCNHDDYFHPDPTAGSYLERKFNLANDSTFLERTDSVAPVMGDFEVKDVSELYANPGLTVLNGTAGLNFSYQIELSAVAADNGAVGGFAVARTARRPFDLVNGSCPGGDYGPAVVTSALLPVEGFKRQTTATARPAIDIPRAGCYRFDAAAEDTAGNRSAFSPGDVVRISSPPDHAVEPVKDLLEGL